MATGEKLRLYLNEPVRDLVCDLFRVFIVVTLVHTAVGDDTMILEIEAEERHCAPTIRQQSCLFLRVVPGGNER